MPKPAGSLHNERMLCHVSASCHKSAMLPNKTADAPKSISPNSGRFLRYAATEGRSGLAAGFSRRLACTTLGIEEWIGILKLIYRERRRQNQPRKQRRVRKQQL